MGREPQWVGRVALIDVAHCGTELGSWVRPDLRKTNYCICVIGCGGLGSEPRRARIRRAQGADGD